MLRMHKQTSAVNFLYRVRHPSSYHRDTGKIVIPTQRDVRYKCSMNAFLYLVNCLPNLTKHAARAQLCQYVILAPASHSQHFHNALVHYVHLPPYLTLQYVRKTSCDSDAMKKVVM